MAKNKKNKQAEPLIFRHFNGELYALVCTAVDVESKKEIVVLQSIRTNKLWSRTKESFEANINEQRRFTPINEAMSFFEIKDLFASVTKE